MAKKPVKVETLTHDKAARLNIPTAEYQSVAERIEEQRPAEPAHYMRARPLAEGATRKRDEDQPRSSNQAPTRLAGGNIPAARAVENCATGRGWRL